MRRVALSLLLLSLAAVASAADAPPPVPVQVVRAKQQSFAPLLTATGTIASRNDARLSAEVGGALKWIAEPGRAIRKGEVVARVDDERLKLALRDNEAAVSRLEANVRLLKAQNERFESLAPGNIVSKNQLEEANSRFAMAQQELEQSRVARDRAALDLQRATVRAPFTGYVAERLQQAGEYVTPGMPVARLVDTRNVEVVAHAPIANASSIRIGQAVRVRDDNRTIESRVQSVVPVGDERSRLLEMRIALNEAEWPIGSPVRVELSGATQQAAITVPRDAVIQRQGASYVFRVDEKNTAERVTVRVGTGRNSDVEVSGDVHANDQIVVRGGERLQPGQTVSIQDGGGAKGTLT
jgi:RND family efflux transporter MFP subunit